MIKIDTDWHQSINNKRADIKSIHNCHFMGLGKHQKHRTLEKQAQIVIYITIQLARSTSIVYYTKLSIPFLFCFYFQIAPLPCPPPRCNTFCFTCKLRMSLGSESGSGCELAAIRMPTVGKRICRDCTNISKSQESRVKSHFLIRKLTSLQMLKM